MSFLNRTLVRFSLLVAVIAAPAAAASCAHSQKLGSGGGDDEGGIFTPSSSGGGTSSGTIITGGGGMGMCADGTQKCNDFQTISDPNGMPSGDPSSSFGPAGSGTMNGGPCLVEPADNALFPKNWLRPRIFWKAGSSSQNVFEVRLHADGETNDMVVYTTKTYWTMPLDLWQKIAFTPASDAGATAMDGSLVGGTITVTVRASSGSGQPAISNSAKFTIAPAIADGALVYWTTSSFDTTVATNTTLQGFHVGDEGYTQALSANQVQQQVRASPIDGGNTTGNTVPVYCIGCHSATPDGNYVAFSAQWPWPEALANIQSGQAGLAPPWLGKGAAQNLSPNYEGNAYSIWYAPPAVNQVMLGISTFSPAHYAAGDRILISSLGASWNSTGLSDPGIATGVVSELAWFNLEWENASTMSGGLVDSGLPMAPRCTNPSPLPATNQPCVTPQPSNGGWGIIARNGDGSGAGAPNWSHNANGTDAIAYASTNSGVKDGRMDCSVSTRCASDVYVVPYTSNGPGKGGAGGVAKGLPGASDSAYNEYYPAWSPDDALIAFNRVPAGTSMYNQPKAEVYVVPYNGGNGGTATRLQANDPVSCTGFSAGQVQNTWPKWAPNPLNSSGKPVVQTDMMGNTYYWLTFSSTRSPNAGTTLDPTTGQTQRNQQLYVTGVVVDSSGNVKTFAPIYLWNQDFTVNNLIPAWGEFGIPQGKMPPPATTAL